MFIAGAETTSNSIGIITSSIHQSPALALFLWENNKILTFYCFIGFALLYLLHHQDIQQKIQEEIDQVCGDGIPQLAHRSRYCKFKTKIHTVD